MLEDDVSRMLFRCIRKKIKNVFVFDCVYKEW